MKRREFLTLALGAAVTAAAAQPATATAAAPLSSAAKFETLPPGKRRLYENCWQLYQTFESSPEGRQAALDSLDEAQRTQPKYADFLRGLKDVFLAIEAQT